MLRLDINEYKAEAYVNEARKYFVYGVEEYRETAKECYDLIKELFLMGAASGIKKSVFVSGVIRYVSLKNSINDLPKFHLKNITLFYGITEVSARNSYKRIKRLIEGEEEW